MEAEANKKEILALIRLLDDRDEYVRDKVRERLVELGAEALPFLETASIQENLKLRSMVRQTIREITPNQLTQKFIELSESGTNSDIDLEAGVMLLMQFGNPDADPASCRKILDGLADELRKNIRPEDMPEKIVRRFSQFIFHEKGFTGNRENYYDPGNSYLDKLLSRKTGIPISMSVLCLLIGHRLGLPLVGVGLPGHFIVKHNSLENPVLFDPFNNGRILKREDCAALVRSFGLDFQDSYLNPSTHREILVRMLQNLILVYKKTDQKNKAQRLMEIARILTTPSKEGSSNRQ